MSKAFENPVVMSLSILLLGFGTFFGAKAIKKTIVSKREDKAGGDVDSKNPTTAAATIYAQRLKAAFNPSGYNWMQSYDGTNESAIYAVAKEMFTNKVPFTSVQSAYKNLYQRSLTSDLQTELEASELQKFYALQKTGLGSINLLGI